MRTSRRGVALVLVLWLVVVLAAITAAAVALSRSEANTVVAYRSRAVARAAAASGVEAAVALIRPDLARSEPEAQAGLLPRVRGELDSRGAWSLGTGRFQVAIQDLSGRIPINSADYMTLLRLFELTAGEDRAEELAARVTDWLDPDDSPRPGGGAEAAEYEAAGSPYRPLNRPFQRIEEVGRLLGVDDSLAAVLDTMVTVYGSGFVNVNSASAAVVQAATGMDPGTVNQLMGARPSAGFSDLEQVRAALGRTGFVPVSVAPSRLMVVSRGWAEGRPYTREVRAVVELRGWANPDGPEAAIIAWEERDL